MPSDFPNLIFGCGYLGRRVAMRWLAAGEKVIAVTRSAARAAEFREAGLTPAIGDVCDAGSLPELPARIDTVLFAVGYDRSSGKTQEQVFVEGMRSVLDSLGTRCRRFLYISSTGVYGQADGSWVDEASPCEPVQPGGVCCLAAERLIQDHFTHVDPASSSAVLLRLAGIYGPQRLLSRIADLRSGKPLSGRPDAWLNLIHVDDAATAVIAAADHDSPPPVVLVADDEPLRRMDYYHCLAKLVSAPPPVFDDAQPRSRGSGGLNKRCSNRQLKEKLGVRLRYPTCETGLPVSLAFES